MKRSGVADLPLHGGRVPPWLATRMVTLGTAIAESVLHHYGRSALLSRLSDPFWFQALGSVMGMDWHSSGITTSVMGALKRGLNPQGARARRLRLRRPRQAVAQYAGRAARRSPSASSLDGDALVRTSRLTARIDNNAIADGFQIYLHSFVLTPDGEWAVVQQGMNEASRLGAALSLALGGGPRLHRRSAHRDRRRARRHDHEPRRSPGAAGAGCAARHRARGSRDARSRDVRRLEMPAHHDVRADDVNEKRLGAVLALAHERDLRDFASFLLLEQLGPRTLQSLALIAEVVHGTPTRFDDPARFSFAHGGKDGHPFPVPLTIYDESIAVLRRALDAAKLGHSDKLRRHVAARRVRPRDRRRGAARKPTSPRRSRTSARSRDRSAAAPCSTTRKPRKGQLALFQSARLEAICGLTTRLYLAAHASGDHPYAVQSRWD